jgi:predicted transposase YbfD/YdcC
MRADFEFHFSDLPDPRVNRRKVYPLLEIVFLVVSAAISGCDGWKAIKDFGDIKIKWLRKFFPYENGIPVDDTIARLMGKLNTKAFQGCFINWISSAMKAVKGDVVSIDGKTLRRSHDRTNEKSAIHMVSAWSHAYGLVLGQEKTEEKSNEITAIPALLEVLALKGCIVTLDAMGCQTEIVAKIVEKKADYVIAVKGNQATMHEEISDYFQIAQGADFKSISHDYHKELDMGHGRVESRECWTINANQPYFTKMHCWKNIKSVAMVVTERDLGDKKTRETRYFLSSLASDAKTTLSTVRQHWGIENSLHWVLDMTFREDESRIRRGVAAENFAMVRHMALNVLKRDKSVETSIASKKRMAAFDDKFRTKLIRQAF